MTLICIGNECGIQVTTYVTLLVCFVQNQLRRILLLNPSFVVSYFNVKGVDGGCLCFKPPFGRLGVSWPLSHCIAQDLVLSERNKQLAERVIIQGCGVARAFACTVPGRGKELHGGS